MRLYELIDRYEAICDLAFEESDDEGRLSEEFTQMLQHLEDDLGTKFEQCGYALKNLEASEAALKAEADRLNVRRKRIEDKRDRLKAFLKDQLERLGKTKYQAGIFNYSIRANGGSPTVNVLDEAAIPEDYWYQPPAVVDKKLIVEVAKEGIQVPGVELVRGTHLRVS